MSNDDKARDAVEQTDDAVKGTNVGGPNVATDEQPAAGPHGKEELIDRDSTPGTGSLPEPDAEQIDIGPA